VLPWVRLSAVRGIELGFRELFGAVRIMLRSIAEEKE
jgi:hypothetical protein